MAEYLSIAQGTLSDRYEHLLIQLDALLADEDDLVANMANVAAALHTTFNWLWVGFYRVDATAQQLVLGPFQGPIACTRIPWGRGVCGTAWATKTTQIVPDVMAFPGHIACSSLAQSEIVLPMQGPEGEVVGVLDVDAVDLAVFSEVDAHYLGLIVSRLLFASKWV